MSRAPRLTLETVLCDRRFFGLETATPVQRACCRVIDGLPLGELADDANVIALVGGAPALASLPVGQPPHRVDIIGSIRSAKSMTAAAAAFAASQTVDVSGLKPGEVPRIPIVAPRMDLGRVEFGMLCAQAAEKPAIAARLIGQPTSDTIVFRHPSGMPIEVMITAASSGGTSLVSRWVARAIFTEAPRTASETEGAAVNLESMLAAVDGRLLRGGSIITNGSPTTPTGEIFNAYEKRFGKPTPHHVVLHGTGPMFNPGYFTPEKCAQLQESNRRSYVTDV